jgi:hypothetical protein
MSERDKLADKCRTAWSLRVAYGAEADIFACWKAVADAALAFNAERVRELRQELLEAKGQLQACEILMGKENVRVGKERDEARAEVARLKASVSEFMFSVRKDGFFCPTDSWIAFSAALGSENAKPSAKPVERRDCTGPETSAKPVPSLPALWTWVWSLRTNRWAKVFWRDTRRFWVVGEAEPHLFGASGESWTARAQERRPKVGDEVWAKFGFLKPGRDTEAAISWDEHPQAETTDALVAEGLEPHREDPHQ